ncbi:hypothetical protein PR048_016798, partial [Dryococelus australis]
MPLVGGFSRVHSGAAPCIPQSPSSALKTSVCPFSPVNQHFGNMWLAALSQNRPQSQTCKGPRCLGDYHSRLPPRRTGFNSRPGHRTMPLVGGFPRGSPVSPAPSCWRCSMFTSITLIGCQDLSVRSHPNLFTHSRTCKPAHNVAAAQFNHSFGDVINFLR